MNTRIIHVFIPAYNEEDSIGCVVKELKKLDMNLKIIVVDDGSKDNTVEEAKKAGAIVIKHAINLGQWAALRTAFMISLQTDAEIVVTLDADGQHSPENLLSIVEPVLNGEADLVIGSRFLDTNNHEMPIYRYIGIKFFNILLALITGLNLSDCTCGYKAYNIKLVSNLLPLLNENQYGALESLIFASKINAKICERSVFSIPSNRTKKGIITFAYNLVRSVIKTAINSLDPISEIRS